MASIIRPMLATTPDEHYSIRFPVLATPKIDGIRALKIDGVIVSRSFKPIPNFRIRELLQELLPDGADGEITSGSGFYDTTSAVMTQDRACEFTFYWFDWVPQKGLPYTERIRMIQEYANTHQLELIVLLIPDLINDQDTLDRYEQQALEMGYEGVMLRRPDGMYKPGRSTLSEGLLIKLKRYRDSEATVIGAEELMHNNNEPRLDNLRQNKQRHLVGGDTLGALVAQTDEGIVFKIGTGYTDKQRAELWASRDDIISTLVKYKYMSYGNKTAPRSPVFIGIRHADDVNSNITVYTIGFTKKTAQEFFTKISQAGVERIIDVRINNTSQLAGFTKMEDLRYLAREICNIDYVHMPLLAPTREMYGSYKRDKNNAAWDAYKEKFVTLITERRIEMVDRNTLSNACLLCSEDTPDRCHRKLVTDYLCKHQGSIEVVHIV